MAKLSGGGRQHSGAKLTGATSFGFNGTAATFTVMSGSEITTNAPASATTGEVMVVTPSGVLASNVPQRHSFGAGSLMSFPWMRRIKMQVV